MNKKEKRITVLSCAFWVMTVLSYVIAAADEYSNPTTCRAEAGMGAAFLWMLIIFPALLIMLWTAFLAFRNRRELGKKYFWLGLSPILAIVVFICLAVGLDGTKYQF